MESEIIRRDMFIESKYKPASQKSASMYFMPSIRYLLGSDFLKPCSENVPHS